MKLLAKIFGQRRSENDDAVRSVLASLILAAREDAAFRERVMLVLQLPPLQRESLVKTAVEEMERRGEPAEMRAAFLALATPDGAEIAARAIASG